MTTAITTTTPTTATTLNNTNRIETHKLYMTLLQFSLYDNPYKYYSRKIKLKKVPPLQTASSSSSSSHSGGPVEYIIVSSYPSSGSSSLRTADANASANANANASANANANAVIKPRKKMKLTTSGLSDKDDFETECEPELPKCQKIIEDEQVSNVIIFKPIEHEKMKNMKYSLSELKTLCSHYGIKKSGTKSDLSQRIYIHLKQSYYIMRIQHIFRQFISRKYRTLCGPGYLHTSKCVNDTDFYTFDKLSNIKPTELFTYRDNDDKIYGFHIASIFHLIISSYPNITNPYNRKIIPADVIKNMYEKLIYGSILGFRVSVKLDDNGDDDDDGSNGNGNGNAMYSTGGGQSLGNGSTIPVDRTLSREKQEELFVVDLFQHINTLGNYSDSEWFIALQRVDFIRFIRNLHDIWYYRANLSQDMKDRICPPNGNPFMLNNAHINLNVLTLLTDPEIRTICVSVIDRIVRRGVSREDQCLGAFYVLATLTIVSQDARNALPWLYEAVM
jgi:hypothetical protein